MARSDDEGKRGLPAVTAQIHTVNCFMEHVTFMFRNSESPSASIYYNHQTTTTMPPKTPHARPFAQSFLLALFAPIHYTPSPATHQQIRTIRSIKKTVRLSRFDHAFALPTLGSSPKAALDRKHASNTLPLRTGALATKKGMTALYDPVSGKRTPCTVLQMDRVQVVAHKTRETHGYFAVCLGSGWRHPTNVDNAMLGVFAKSTYTNKHGGEVGMSPKEFVREFRVKDESGLLGIGEMVTPSWFKEGQFVDTRSKNRGMGFAGVS